MKAWIIVVIALGVLFMIVMLVPIKIKLFISREKHNDYIRIRLKTLFGLVTKSYNVPVLNFQSLRDGLTASIESNNDFFANKAQEKNKVQITADTVIEFFENIRKAMRLIHGLSDWFKQTLKCMKCTRLRWETYVGFGDAAETAITAGALWGLKTSMLGFLFRFIHIEDQPIIEVVPQYNKPQFSTEFQCELRIRLGQALLAQLYLLSRYRKNWNLLWRWRFKT